MTASVGRVPPGAMRYIRGVIPGEPMSGVDAAWFRMDRPENTADVVALLSFSAPPDLAKLRELVASRLLRVRRFRQRAVRGGIAGGDRWEDDPRLDLDRHLVASTLRGDRERALRDFVSGVASEPLDPEHPPWRVWLLGAEGGGAIVAKLAHCMADGFALVALLLSLADERPEPRGAPHLLAAYRRLEPWIHPEETLRAALRDPSRALAAGRVLVGASGALLRMTALSARQAGPLDGRLTGRRRVAWSAALPLAAVRAAARARDATVNDVLVAAVAGALRSYLLAAGQRLGGAPVRALVPVNLRPGPPETAETLGNRFGLAFLDLPVEEPSAEGRLRELRARAARLKTRPDAAVTFNMLRVVGTVPWLEPWALRFFSRKASVVVTNVPGPRERLHVAGEAVESAMFWVPHPATLGVGISLLSYAGEVRVGVRSDVGVVPDPERIAHLFELEVDALRDAPAHVRA